MNFTRAIAGAGPVRTGGRARAPERGRRLWPARCCLLVLCCWPGAWTLATDMNPRTAPPFSRYGGPAPAAPVSAVPGQTGTGQTEPGQTGPALAGPGFGISLNRAWQRYQSEFVSSAGRVIDRAQGEISHSEGQGYGLLLALLLDDRATFDRIWRWTQSQLAVRDDALLAWRWSPARTGVSDKNNATDGDILVAWALLQASARWSLPRYQSAGLRLLAAIRAELSFNPPGRKYLLPGKDGFVETDGVWLNPSYCLLPAFTAFAQADTAHAQAEPDAAGFWQQLRADCVYLSAKATEFNAGAVPDWVKLNHQGSIVAVRAGASDGADAIRLPLYFAWDNQSAPGLPALLATMARRLPPPSADPASTSAATASPTTASTPTSTSPPAPLAAPGLDVQPPDTAPSTGSANALNYLNAGYYAVLARAAGMSSQGRQLARQADIAWTVEPAQYYPDSLYLLARFQPMPVPAGTGASAGASAGEGAP